MTQFLYTQQVIDIHDAIIHSIGGRTGIMNLGLLYSAVEVVKSSMDGKLFHPTYFDQASAYLFHILRTPPFIDGNKRTAIASALIFLYNNRIHLILDELELEQLVLDTACGKIKKREISDYFQKHQALKQ